jgi:transposase
MKLSGLYLMPFQRKLLQEKIDNRLLKSYQQRIKIMLLADDGKSQAEICQTLGCSPATASHWIHIAKAGMAHQWEDCPIGRPKEIGEEYVRRLQELLLTGPRDYGYVFSRWTVSWLNKHLTAELEISISDRHLKRILKSLELSTKLPKLKQAYTPENRIKIADLNYDYSLEISELSIIEFHQKVSAN